MPSLSKWESICSSLGLSSVSKAMLEVGKNRIRVWIACLFACIFQQWLLHEKSKGFYVQSIWFSELGFAKKVSFFLESFPICFCASCHYFSRLPSIYICFQRIQCSTFWSSAGCQSQNVLPSNCSTWKLQRRICLLSLRQEYSKY